MDLEKVMKDGRMMRALTGLSAEAFGDLTRKFGPLLREQRGRRPGRKTSVGSGRIGALKTDALKLFFVLFYLKVYPTYDVLGALFGKPRGRSHDSIKEFLPILEKALGRQLALPVRQIRSVEEFYQRFPGVRDVFIDGTERPIQRPQRPRGNRRHYSGKKKSHQRKQVVVSDERRRILILTAAKPGRRHDKNLSDRAQLTRHLPPEVGVFGDTAFTGNQHPNLQIPQKARKNRPLSEEQRAENRWVSQARVVVEHAIGGMKRFGVMRQKLRNKIGRFDDQAALVCAGLWNFHLAHAA